MIAKINNFEVDLSKPIDISISLSNTDENPIAWYIEKPVIEPVVLVIGLEKFLKEVLQQISIISTLIPTDTERTPNVWDTLPKNSTR